MLQSQTVVEMPVTQAQPAEKRHWYSGLGNVEERPVGFVTPIVLHVHHRRVGDLLAVHGQCRAPGYDFGEQVWFGPTSSPVLEGAFGGRGAILPITPSKYIAVEGNHRPLAADKAGAEVKERRKRENIDNGKQAPQQNHMACSLVPNEKGTY